MCFAFCLIDLLRLVVPPPHDLLQGVHTLHFVTVQWTGQILYLLHSMFCTVGGQAFPPYLAWFFTLRVLFHVPAMSASIGAHEMVHSDQLPHLVISQSLGHM
jgi:hypothetical protein